MNARTDRAQKTREEAADVERRGFTGFREVCDGSHAREGGKRREFTGFPAGSEGDRAQQGEVGFDHAF